MNHNNEGRSAPDLLTQEPVNVPGEIFQWLQDWDRLRPMRAALMAVVGVHEHKLLDEWMRPTDRVADARYARCEACGNLPDGTLWCPTLMAVATELGVLS